MWSCTEESILLLESTARFARDAFSSEVGHNGAAPVSLDAAIDRAGRQGLLSAPLPEHLGGADLPLVEQCRLVTELARRSATFAAIVANHFAALNAILEVCETSEVGALLGEAHRNTETPLAGFALVDSHSNDRYLTPVDPDTCAILIAASDAQIFVTPLPPWERGRGEGDHTAGAPERDLYRGEGDHTADTPERDPYRGEGDHTAGASEPDKIKGGGVPVRWGSGLEGLYVHSLTSGELGASRHGITDRVVARRTLARYQLLVAATQVGNAGAACAIAVEYAKQRRQTGRLIVDHQNVRAMLSAMIMQVNAGESFVLRAATDPDQFRGSFDLCAQAHQFAGMACEQVCLDAIQILGGYGYMKDYGTERRLRDCKSIQSLLPSLP